MSAQWTPGPWQVSYAHDGTGYPRFAIHGLSGDTKRNMDALDATAYLIASAPDLYAALEHAVHALERLGVNAPTELDRMRAALAKAKGE